MHTAQKFPLPTRYVSSQKVQTASGANPASFNGFPGLFEGVKRPGREVTTRHHLVLRLKMSGAVPLLRIYIYMCVCVCVCVYIYIYIYIYIHIACRGKNLPCILYRDVSSGSSVQANLNILFLYDTLQLFFPMYTYLAVSLLFRFCVFVLFCFIGVLVLAYSRHLCC
jgi:hypothetical protein